MGFKLTLHTKTITLCLLESVYVQTYRNDFLHDPEKLNLLFIIKGKDELSPKRIVLSYCLVELQAAKISSDYSNLVPSKFKRRRDYLIPTPKL